MKIFLSKFFFIFIFFFSFISAKDHYAVLVAGSKSWGNYRHQANIYHMYNILLQFGWSPDNIITMVFDDIANNKNNPFPGQVFNKPDGPDVYKNFRADYTGYNVSFDTFMNVCTGKKEEMQGIGTGRVLESKEDDNVILFFADHGGDNCIAFPRKTVGQSKVNRMLTQMKELKKFDKMLFYVESCHSGSLFNETTKLDQELNIWITTSANNSENSHSTYCDEEATVNGTVMGTCLGGQFATCFLEKLENSPLKMTLEEQYQYMKECTTRSHPSQFGKKERANDTLEEYFLNEKNPINKRDFSKIDEGILEKKKKYKVVEDKSAYLNSLKYLAEHGDNEDKKNYENALLNEKKSNYIFREFKKEFGLPEIRQSEKIDFDCYEKLIDFYENTCQPDIDIDIYRYTYFASFCTMKLPTSFALTVLNSLCSKF